MAWHGVRPTSATRAHGCRLRTCMARTDAPDASRHGVVGLARRGGRSWRVCLRDSAVKHRENFGVGVGVVECCDTFVHRSSTQNVEGDTGILYPDPGLGVVSHTPHGTSRTPTN